MSGVGKKRERKGGVEKEKTKKEGVTNAARVMITLSNGKYEGF